MNPSIQAQLEAAARIMGEGYFKVDYGNFYRYGRCLYGCPTGSQVYERYCQVPDCLEKLPFNPDTSAEDRELLAKKMRAVVDHANQFVSVPDTDYSFADSISVYWGYPEKIVVGCSVTPDFPSALLLLAYLVDKESQK